MMHAFALLFLVCATAAPDDCQDGVVLARSCAAAEAYIRAGVAPTHRVVILDCARRT